MTVSRIVQIAASSGSRAALSRISKPVVVMSPLLTRNSVSGRVALSNSAFHHVRMATPGRQQQQHSRLYSSSSNHNDMLNSFAAPLTEFLLTLSRIARIISLSALGIATVGLVGFEAAHQYVEHVSMKQDIDTLQASKDEWGWLDQFVDESWNGDPRGGTDSRLGIRGRHAVRSAWMALNWGGGIDPSLVFNNSNTSQNFSQPPQIDDGTTSALAYMSVVSKIAKAKGIQLPDVDAIRAGLLSWEKVEPELAHLDATALALQNKLASIQERKGSQAFLEAAAISYETIFDLLSHQTEKPVTFSTSRLVRLANKIGDLHSLLGDKSTAETWLQKAVSLAGGSDGIQPTSTTTHVELGSDSAIHTAESKREKSRSSASQPTDNLPSSLAQPIPASLPVTTTTVAPTPALTRALISTLLSLSALYAQKASSSKGLERSWLEQALQVQAGALKLAQIECDRLSGSSKDNDSAVEEDRARQLHRLWVQYQKSVIGLHLAETTYALETNSSDGEGSRRKGVMKRIVSSLFQSKPDGSDCFVHSQSWLDNAKSDAQTVVAALTVNAFKNQNNDQTQNVNKVEVAAELDLIWEKNGLKTFAKRLARDAGRVESTTLRLEKVLQQQQQRQQKS